MTLPTPARAGQVQVYVARPTSPGPWPGIVVIHEAFGLNDDIRGYADRLAAQGYLAVAPDLYSWGPKLRCVAGVFRSLLRREGPAWPVLRSVRDWTAGRAECTGRVGVIGFCMGGGFALLAAPRLDLAAASVNYGQVPEDAEALLRGSCPIVGSFGGADRATRGHPQRLERALSALGVEHDVKEYPGVGHSFLNRHSGALAVLDKVLGAGYSAPAAEDAWARISAFLDGHLRDGPGSRPAALR